MKGNIPQSVIQEIIERVDLVDIIQPRLSLKKHGKNFFAQCPFHNEKTASFSVNTEKQFYYCFGCKASGNAVKFLMNYEQMEFMDALNQLASRAGMDLSQYDTHKPDPSFAPLYQILEASTKEYQKALRNSAFAIQYLKKREVSGKIAKEFRLGFAPNLWDFLSKQFKTKDMQQQLMTTGMTIKNKARCYDRFRNRIMFPIRNLRGQVVGYGGRSFDNEPPKYLNSPETPLFHKSSILYGLYEAKQKNSSLEKILIVEGYMDVIALAEHGISYAAATLGTAIHRKHLQLLLRHSSSLIFCLDGDTAGRAAAWQALTLALPLLREGIHIQFLFLPQKEDPDSYVRQIGASKFEELLKNAPSIEEVLFEKLKQDFPIHTLENKAHFAKAALELINTMPQGIYQTLLQEKLAQLLQIKKSDLETAVLPNKPNNSPPLLRKRDTNKQLIPWQLITALLLKDASLIKVIPNTPNFMHAVEKFPVLKRLLEILQNAHTAPSVGSILPLFESEEDQKLIATLAAHSFPIPKEGMVVELLGGVERLQQKHYYETSQQLIEKGRKFGLNEEEKQLLQSLLLLKK
jgi:DNA primase